jgi:hypothetical protein
MKQAREQPWLLVCRHVPKKVRGNVGGDQLSSLRNEIKEES